MTCRLVRTVAEACLVSAGRLGAAAATPRELGCFRSDGIGGFASTCGFGFCAASEMSLIPCSGGVPLPVWSISESRMVSL